MAQRQDREGSPFQGQALLLSLLTEVKMVPFSMQSLLRWHPFTVHEGHLYQAFPNEVAGGWELVRTQLR